MKHLLGAAVLIAVLAVLAVAGLEAMHLPGTASTEAVQVDRLFRYEMWAVGALGALILGLMAYSIVVFRRRGPDVVDGRHVHGNTGLEIFWTVGPLVLVVGYGLYAASMLQELAAAAPDPLVVNVTGSQWSWSFEYPDQGVTSSTLVLEKDRPTLFQITSLDVLHSFWILEFRLKQDAVPGWVRPLQITPNKTGTFTVRCAEICGAGHTYMFADVKVVEATDFDQELSDAVSGANLTPEERGAKLAKDLGCAACHSVDGSKLVGPSWLGMIGREELLEGGGTVVVDDAYVTESVLDPAAKTVAGFNKDIMPKNFPERLKEGDLDAIIAYMHTLTVPAAP